MLRSLSASLLWRGLLAVAVGIVAILWPGVTIAAVVVIFAVAVFIDAVHQTSRAFSSQKAGPVAGHLLLALLDIAAGVVAIAWPGITALALTIWIGAWAVVTGVGEFAMAFASYETAGERALYGFGGLLSVILGVALFARPDLGALSLAEVFGIFSLALGVWSLVLAASTRATGSRLDRMLRAPGLTAD
jgi:uncharacterized membrane protein HdeD (DUF308 family)